MDFYGELEWRGLIFGATEGAREALAREKVTGYIGFDPTAASLHVGNLLVMMMLAHLQRHGHSPIAVVGGGTGLIGDPSGKATERQLLTAEEVEKNVQGIRAQLSRFLDFDATNNPARLVNNADWLTKLGAIEFMRDVGKHFSVNVMMAKESVKRRMEGEEGISYTEFSYSLLQAYDFLMLHDRFNCTLQMGGSDQYGNILAGMDLIRRVRGGKAHGVVMPLITTASGAKFGKSESGAIWLDPSLTTPYEFYQFWLNTVDHDVVRYLKFFTFLDAVTIDELAHEATRHPEQRRAQRVLASEVTRLVHGETAANDAESAAQTLFARDLSGRSASDLEELLANVPSVTLESSEGGWPLITALVAAGAAASRGEATRLVRSGGVYVNDQRVQDEKHVLSVEAAIEGRLFVLRRGKRDYFLLRVPRG